MEDAFDRIIIISNMDFMHTASGAILVIPVAMVAGRWRLWV
jgi:hypothetical protein